MKDKMIIPDYDFKVNNSCGALERIMHDQKNPPHMLQTIHPISKTQFTPEEDVDCIMAYNMDGGVTTCHTNGTIKETKKVVK